MLIEAELSFSVIISVIWFDIRETILNVPAKIKAPTPPITPPVVAKAPLPLKNDIARFFAPPFEAAFRDLWVPPPLTLLRHPLDWVVVASFMWVSLSLIPEFERVAIDEFSALAKSDGL